MLVGPLAEKGLAPLDGGPTPNSSSTLVFGKHFRWGEGLQPVQWVAASIRGGMGGTRCGMMPQPSSS